MVNQQTFDILRLIRSRNLGVQTFYKLLKIFETPKNVLENLACYTKQNPIIPCSEKLVQEEIENCEEVKAEIITIFDESYPHNLKQIINPPPILTIRGNKRLLNANNIAVVGARNASANAYNFANKIARELGQEGFVIVSGLARGIDTSAHQGSINTGTIAVIAGGINNIYPSENEGLYYDIVEKGLIISELPFGTIPRGQYFPARNRIVSGLSKGVIIVEASLRSGTLITANKALEQGREVFVCPGNPYDPRCEGSNRLLKEGAILITEIGDIIETINNFKIPTKIQQEYSKSQQLKESDLFDDELLEENFFDILSEETGEIKETNVKINEPKTIKQLILNKLNNVPIAIESLNEQLELNIVETNRILTELELEEKIAIEFGKVRKI
jgi:DNA processing protein